MTTATRSVKKADKLVETFAFICTHPLDWNQTTWRCGAGMCFAGHAAISVGKHREVVPSFEIAERLGIGDYVWARTAADKASEKARLLSDHLDTSALEQFEATKPLVKKMDAEIVSIRAAAKAELGLGSDEADCLFGANNDLTDLLGHLSDILGITDKAVMKLVKARAKERGWRWPRKQLVEQDFKW